MKFFHYTLKVPFEKVKTVVAVSAIVAVTVASMPIRTANADVSSDSSSTSAAGASDEPGSTAPVDFVLPTYDKVTVVKSYQYVPMSAYTSRAQETDSTPFITADGSHVRDGIIAANFLPFGTKVRIPSLFGDKIFEVHDRMNKRYPLKVDVWMEGLGDALQFGVKYANIEIVKVETINAPTTSQTVHPALAGSRPRVIR
ncbi:MAG: hypothetical protein WC477_06580 [Patescibacteria group bacterium]